MVHDDDSVAEHSSDPRRGGKLDRPGAGRVLLFTGVAGACALGAGLGLWARPSDIEQPATAKAHTATVTPVSGPRRIPIVVDDTPAPIGKPLDVLAPSPARPAVAPPQVQPPEMIAPSRPPNGLVRVAAPVPGPIESVRPRTLLPPISPPPGLAPAVRPAPADARLRAAELAAEQQRALAAQRTAQKAAEQAQARKFAQAKAAAQKLAQAKAAKAEHARELAEARKEARAERLAELKARREKARAAELAKLAPPPKHGLSALIARLAPHHESREAEQRVEAKADRKAVVKKARLTKSESKAAVRPRPRAEPPPPPLMAPKGGGPIRIANTRCASPDPGEALACGDPALSAAERRLARAYRDAEAAGVPAATLAQQQQRWKQARAAAAREAPWAVRDVYQARIAELQDMTRDAQGN